MEYLCAKVGETVNLVRQQRFIRQLCAILFYMMYCLLKILVVIITEILLIYPKLVHQISVYCIYFLYFFYRYTAGKPVTQESSLDVFCHVIFDVMDVKGRPQEFVAL